MFRGMLAVLMATAMTAFCWGVYGPVILQGQHAMGESRLRPFICVGLAYFAIAVVAPIVVLRMTGEKGSWTFTGFVWSLFAGALGALGALGIILAFSFHGQPLFVMPLVFGVAPVVNTFTTMYLGRSFKQVGPVFLAGLILVAIGAVTVLVAKPGHPTAKITEDESGAIRVVMEEEKDGATQEATYAAGSAEELQQNFPKAYKEYEKKKHSDQTLGQFALTTCFIAMAALCWGAYGPVLHKGQLAMQGSRLRPLICVGLAYFVIAVIVPLILLAPLEPEGAFTGMGVFWSLLGGAAGAVGALGIIMAFNWGGKPVYVMPLVFGCAPVINAFTEIIGKDMYDQIGPLFYAGLIVVVVGAVIVLVFAPKSAPHAPAPSSHTQPAVTS